MPRAGSGHTGIVDASTSSPEVPVRHSRYLARRLGSLIVPAGAYDFAAHRLAATLPCSTARGISRKRVECSVSGTRSASDDLAGIEADEGDMRMPQFVIALFA